LVAVIKYSINEEFEDLQARRDARNQKFLKDLRIENEAFLDSIRTEKK
jgi:hypothetical protein